MATILIIDDEEPIRALLRTTLEAAGYEVAEATNGKDAVRPSPLSPMWPSSLMRCPCSTASRPRNKSASACQERGPHLYHARQRGPAA